MRARVHFFSTISHFFSTVFINPDIYILVILLDQVGYPNGDCQAGISAEYTSDGEDLVMGTIGVKQFRGKNLYSHIHIFFDWIWRLLWAIIINNWSQRVIQHKTTDQKNGSFSTDQQRVTNDDFCGWCSYFPAFIGSIVPSFPALDFSFSRKCFRALGTGHVGFAPNSEARE